MAPERINPMGDKSYDIRSDVWSLGISMIEIATGRYPGRSGWVVLSAVVCLSGAG